MKCWRKTASPIAMKLCVKLRVRNTLSLRYSIPNDLRRVVRPNQAKR
ncbi:Uncharacterised protein [Vibrio cholerae]|nr:Uncharacterised protein [Vibrio cholerae]